eukprot:TRINITY_DN4627_c0_g1_i4.p1 TRINITY_DN4627_c0_g1~~TRINITY_DN4627_c0_g1_i4.p1  ORF type:complete len:395 (-),score=64.88 TRINITY_DN4627_c0_g1_i4:253-1320(-)
MENILNNQVLSVLYKCPVEHEHITRPPQGVIMPKKSVSELDTKEARLWHEDNHQRGHHQNKRFQNQDDEGRSKNNEVGNSYHRPAHLGESAHRLISNSLQIRHQSPFMNGTPAGGILDRPSPYGYHSSYSGGSSNSSGGGHGSYPEHRSNLSSGYVHQPYCNNGHDHYYSQSHHHNPATPVSDDVRYEYQRERLWHRQHESELNFQMPPTNRGALYRETNNGISNSYCYQSSTENHYAAGEFSDTSSSGRRSSNFSTPISSQHYQRSPGIMPGYSQYPTSVNSSNYYTTPNGHPLGTPSRGRVYDISTLDGRQNPYPSEGYDPQMASRSSYNRYAPVDKRRFDSHWDQRTQSRRY